jgi:quercetin 2,3-dioxygenase
MSNVEVRPPEVECGPDGGRPGVVEVIEPRHVPLGGPRAMTVRRTLPTRGRTMVGAWCFLDHYGPDEVSRTGGMVVPPHPHTGLQTVSWLFGGHVEHRDSLGTVVTVDPGEVNLMTAGRGISHSEVSTPHTRSLEGVQLWTALPDEHRHTEPAFEHYEPYTVEVEGARVAVFVGTLQVEGAAQPLTSPVRTYSPLVGAEVVLGPGAELRVLADPSYEHGVLADSGEVTLQGQLVPHQCLGVVPAGPELVSVRAGEHGARVVLIGGEPLGEQIVMWWNFIGRSHEEIERYREQWQAEVGGVAPEQFGRFDYDGHALPAPALPGVRLRPRV